MKKIKYLLKFGEEKYMKAFASGELYFSNAKMFRDIEEVEKIKGQGDKIEGSSVLSGYKFSFLSEDNVLVEYNNNFRVIAHYEPANNIPVLCMFAVYEEDCVGNGNPDNIVLTQKTVETIKEHFPKADSVAIIKRPYEFLEDVENSIGHRCEMSEVKYFNIDGTQNENNYVDIRVE